MLSRRRHLWLTLPLAVLLAQCVGSHAQARKPEWRVCFYNFADVNQPILASMYIEFSGLLHHRSVSFERGPCAAVSDRVIYVVLRKAGPATERSVLGRAALESGRIMPVLEVYVEPVVSLIGHVRSSRRIGRALARVAAHEVRHYIRQDPGHFHYGLMREGFYGHELVEDDSYPFLERQGPSAL